MQRFYYSNSIQQFCKHSPDEILGQLAHNNQFDLDFNQRNAWLREIALLKNALQYFPSGNIAFEYTIPRVGERIDVIIEFSGILYIIEFKIGENHYTKHAIDQVVDYVLALKYFHQESHHKKIVPLVVCSDAPPFKNKFVLDKDGIYHPILCNEDSLGMILRKLVDSLSDQPFSFDQWLSSPYMPTPTIIEAAQALYRGHNVQEIARSDAGASNLSQTTETINRVIERSKKNQEKSICFVTGVPGAGKTLVGLNIANERHQYDEGEHAVFLSGNGPLVSVLREALARDEVTRSHGSVTKKEAKRKASVFIQNIHHFRDDALNNPNQPPPEKVAIFDEAQRAWTKEKTAQFMSERHAITWDMSEPEFLISAMDRHADWAVIICLIGGGQEIHTGEAGLPAWFDALKNRFPHWNVYVSPQISDEEYTRGTTLEKFFSGLNYHPENNLHLAVSLRSFRSERVSEFVKALLDTDLPKAKYLYSKLQQKYPIVMTRHLEKARDWVRDKARGTERYGLIASSGARRLRQFGIWVQSGIQPENWFLNDIDDVRSSYFLEDTATEFDIQGLEIDWALVAWDANYRIENGSFKPYSFTGSTWKVIRNQDAQLYLKNTYRVLLTRARQGFVIFIPKGSDTDLTRQHSFYDGIYHYLKEVGISELS